MKRFWTALCATTLLAGWAAGQTSPYTSMTVAGTFQNWNPGANNMILVADNTWRMDIFFKGPRLEEFKFTANGSWDVKNWGKDPATGTTPPINGTAVQNGGNIGLLLLSDGLYRFTFNDQTRAYSVVFLGANQTATNLLRNASFELPGFEDDKALHWQFGVPDSYGDLWGNAGRADWRSLDGNNIAYIGSGSFGGFWQDAPAGRGMEYEFSISTWADVEPPFGPWTAANAGIKIEFFGPDRGGKISEVVTPLTGYSNGWTRHSVRGAAPINASFARAVIFADGVGPLGSLQLDAFELTEIPPDLQTFDAWPYPESFSTNYYAGWGLINAKATAANALVGYTAQLKGDGSQSYVLSPYLKSGAGSLTFRYRNASTTADEEQLPTASFVVETSIAGPNSFAFFDEVTGIQALGYETYTINITNELVRYIRIRSTSSDDGLLIEDVQLAPPLGGNPRVQDFNDWTAPADACHTTNGWQLCTGRVQDQAAILAASATASNALRSPFYENGYGAISFTYARGTNGGAAAKLVLQDSPDGTAWRTFHTVTNILLTSPTRFNEFFYEPRGRYVRIVNVPGVHIPTAVVLIDEPFLEGNTEPEGWEFNGVSEYDTESSSGKNPNSLKFDTFGDNIITPALISPTNLSFWAKGNSADPASSLAIDGEVGGSWSNITTVNNFGTEQTYTYAINPAVTRIRFTYDKQGGNVAFDDVLILGGGGTGLLTNQQAVIDNVSIGGPVATYFQDFNAWPTKSSYSSGIDTYGGWRVANAIIDAQNAFDGKVARLTNINGQVISHFLPTGVGLLTFQARTWSGTACNLFILTSPDGNAWQPYTNVSVSGTSYQEYLFFPGLTNGVFLRFLNAGNDRVLIDNIDIQELGEPATVEINGFTDPAAPTAETPVTLVANVRPRNGAEIATVEAYYRIGTNGSYTALTMASSGYNEYASTTEIPRQLAGAIVQYFIRVTYTGPGAVSPAYGPASAPGTPAQYGIPRAASGQVWINEVKYDAALSPPYDDEFIELAGPAEFNLSGWAIEVWDQYASSSYSPVLRERYVIPNNTFLPEDIPGYGFFVLGQASVTQRDMTLTTPLSSNISTTVGIKLLNEGGGLEQELSFGGQMSGFEDTGTAPLDSLFGSPSSSLIGTGGIYQSFSWYDPPFLSGESPTPGEANLHQQFIVEYVAPDAFIIDLVMKTNVQFKVVGNVDNWAVQPMMTEDMSADPIQWTAVSPFNNFRFISTNIIDFAFPAGATNPVFSVKLTAPEPQN